MTSVFESGKCVSVKEICETIPKVHFFINDYQRGYRWTKNETLKLLDDLFNFFKESYKDKKSFYCLQPLIVATGRKNNNDVELLEVLDGQQRLTTIFIILKFINNNSPYTITYKTRNGSEEFLNKLGTQISEDDYNEYIDYLHMYESFEIIKDYKNWGETISLIKEDGTVESKTFKEFVKEGDRIKFIWYDVTEQVLKSGTNDELDDNKIRHVFSRFNAGKIPLTESELIKAIFLSQVKNQIVATDNNSDNKDSIFINKLVEVKRYELSSKWDEIETTLNIPDFWYYIYGKVDEKYSTKIDFLFDIIIKQNKEKRTPFEYYDDKLSKGKVGEKIAVDYYWEEITKIFDMFRNWYSDRTLYHLIGFLRYCDIDIYNILTLFDNAQSHNDFVRMLVLLSKAYAICFDKRNEINKKISALGRLKEEEKKTKYSELKKTLENYSGEDDSQLKEHLSEIEYQSPNIKEVLLLMNILTVVNLKKTDMRLSFANFYSQSYDKEHVSSQTPKDLTDKNEIKNWAIHMLEYITGTEYIVSEKAKKPDKNNAVIEFVNSIKVYQPSDSNETVIVNYLVSKIEKPEPPIFTGNFTEEVLFKQLGINTKSKPFSGDGIQNMVLLDTNTNRGYGNAFFPVKKDWIYKQELKGIYVLPCTKNVFNKAYSKKMDDLMEWTQNDADNYLEVMVEIWQNKLV